MSTVRRAPPARTRAKAHAAGDPVLTGPAIADARGQGSDIHGIVDLVAGTLSCYHALAWDAGAPDPERAPIAAALRVERVA